MDLLGRKRLREQQRAEEIKKILQEEKVFREGAKTDLPKKWLYSILAVLLLGTVIFVIYSSENKTRAECGLMPGLGCEISTVSTTQVGIAVSNFLKEDLNISITLEGCSGSVNNYLKPNTMAIYRFDCSNPEGIVRKKIFLTYVGYSGLPHNAEGALVGKVQ